MLSRYSPRDGELSAPLDRILNAAAEGASQVFDPRDGEFDPDTLARQSARAVRSALAELAELLTIREDDGTATGWRTIAGDRLAALAACIRDDTSPVDPPDLLDRRALRALGKIV